MKVLVLSDAHGARWRIDQLIRQTSPELIVVSGDLPSSLDFPVFLLSLFKVKFNLRRVRDEYVKQSYQRYNDRLTFRQIRTAKRLLISLVKYDIPIILIHGNTETYETRSWLNLFCKRYANIHWISDLNFIHEDVQFLGHGWVSFDEHYERLPTPGEIPEFIAYDLMEKIPNSGSKDINQTVLISHAPPYNTSIDLLPGKNEHAGSRAVRDYLDDGKANVVISGHLHESRGVFQSRKGWWGVNAGSVIDNEVCIIDLSTKNVVWYRNVVYRFGLSPFIYNSRSKREGKEHKNR